MSDLKEAAKAKKKAKAVEKLKNAKRKDTGDKQADKMRSMRSRRFSLEEFTNLKATGKLPKDMKYEDWKAGKLEKMGRDKRGVEEDTKREAIRQESIKFKKKLKEESKKKREELYKR